MFEPLNQVTVDEVHESIPTSHDDTVVTSSVNSRLAINISNPPHRTMGVPDVVIDTSRDDLLSAFGKSTLKDRYLTENEGIQDRFANCVRYYADDPAHAQRMYEYNSKLWCIPSTPVLANGGTRKGNLISCYVNEVEDSLEGIQNVWAENVWLGSRGGGLGTYYNNVRSLGESAGLNGKTSGAMSFIKVNDALVSCISQGVNRRGAGAVYMDISHPEIETFLEMRKPTGGDPNRKAPNLHHGVCISDAFMLAVERGEEWPLISPKDGREMDRVDAQTLMAKLLMARVSDGEPYILFTDTMKRATPEHHKRSGLHPKTSNLCSEITLPTGIDHHGVDRTAVCCLFQLNLETWDQWCDHPTFILDVARYVDNVLQDFIDNAGDKFVKARYSASRERSIGIGTMGFHSFLQQKQIPFESVMAKVWNFKFFKHIRSQLDAASVTLAEERGACPDAAEHGIMERFSYKMAQAPTASVSIIANVSASIDPITANIYTHKTLDGSFEVRNKYLEKVLDTYGMNTIKVWNSINDKNGSVSHLEFLSDEEKSVFRTAFEIDPRYLIDYASDRAPFICQAQSLNIWIEPDIHKRDLWKIHQLIWKKGIKSAYYLRSKSIQRADSTTSSGTNFATKEYVKVDYEVCQSCQ